MTENVSRNGMEPFENPELLPLEELKLHIKTDGVTETVNALNKKWAEERYFLHYEVPKIYNDDESEIIGAKEHWMEVVSYIIDDLKWLLHLPFYRFWSNIVYNNSILNALVSFLQEAPPFYALENFPNCPEMLELLETLRRNVLVVFARLVTNKESPAEYMSRPFLGNLLYENYIFTVPIIFDLCQLYGRENARTMEKILSSLFTLQPLYNDDFRKAVSCLIEALENVERRFNDLPVTHINEAVSLSKKVESCTEITLFDLEDMIIYVLDISSTINTLLKNYPPAVSIFHREDFANKIISVYENTIPEMYKRLDKLAYNDENIPKYIELKHRLDVTRVELLSLFRSIIYQPILGIQENLNTVTEAEVKKHVNDYFTFLSNAISEKEFITDYNQFYPVSCDLEILSSLCPEIDAIKSDYILQPIYAITGKPKPSASTSSHNTIDSVAGPSGIQESQPIASTSSTTTDNEKKEPVDTVELASLVSEVKNILCDLGEGFIEMCLKHYNYDTASVINAILEDNLPPTLHEIDHTLPHIPPDSVEASAAVDLALGVERLNVFDNDEFDIMTHDFIDMSRVHLGKKKEKYKNINDMLNDKSEVKRVSEIYDRYSLITEDYNDEYDDTYDSHDVGGATQDDSLEIESRAFTTPRVLLSKEKRGEVSDEESETEEENGTAEQNDRDSFVQNPAELRSKAEQRRLVARGGKTSPNVVGKPKGQGQDKEVLANRNHKNTRKATQANHNRRSGAQWKRRQGMVPS